MQHPDPGSGLVYTARYVAIENRWEPPLPVSESGEWAGPSDLGMDADGNITLVWHNSRDVVRSARYDVHSGRWSRPRDVSPADQSALPARIAVDASGDVTAVWLRRPPGLDIAYVTGARYRAADDTWSAAVDIERRGDLAGDLQVAADRSGNVTIVWTRDTHDDDDPFIHALRYTPATGRATPIAVLSQVDARYPRIGLDAAGNVLVSWTERRVIGGVVRRIVEGTEWNASPRAPSIAAISSGNGALTIAFNPPATEAPAFAPTTYEYSVDDGARWMGRSPQSTVSPLRIEGLMNGATYLVRLRAVNAAGAGLPSQAVAATPVAGPDAPTGLHVLAQNGRLVTLGWVRPQSGMPPTGYVVEGGVLPGEAVGGFATGSVAPNFTFDAPTGTFYIRVHAVAGTAWSGPSNDIRLFVDQPVAPSAPANLLGLTNGSSLAPSWTNTFAGGTPTALWLNVSGAITTTLPLPIGEAFTFAQVPPGTYTLTVSTSNRSGMSLPSNPVTMTFPAPCTGVPLVPANLQAWKVGNTIFLSWSSPANGAAVTGYTVIAGGAYAGSFPITGRAISGTVGPGTYVLSVSASNACGAGPATPPQIVTIP
jgi:hypothetical protein